jgi:hypothetical protein
MTRRELLLLAAQAALAKDTPDSPGQLIHSFEEQGSHRTGTEIDNVSGDWLMDRVRRIGLPPSREPFTLSRIDPIAATLTIGDRRIEGVPQFDAAFTDAQGIRGRLGPLNSDAPIGITEAAPNTAAAGALGAARRQNRHQAIVVVTRGARPGLCPNNADEFLHPFGPPVLQISSEDRGFLQEGAEAILVAETKRTRSQAFNVTTQIRGTNRKLPPLIVMTPRSGWWTCASERGGGIVCWLELMRTLHSAKPARDVLFVASSGHEVGYIGIEAFVANRPGIVKQAHAWIHFGANIGAAQGPGNTVQASDDEMESIESAALTKAGFRIDRHVPRGNVPGGEAGVVHRGGGRYMSLIGQNALFHNPQDRGPEAIDTGAIARFGAAFSEIAKSLAGTA